MPTYTASKHGVLGLMRSMDLIFAPLNIRTGCIHPWFVMTPLIPQRLRDALAGYHLVPVERVVGAIFYAATDVSEESNGCAWVLEDDGPVLQIVKEEFKVGLYRKMDDRRRAHQQ